MPATRAELESVLAGLNEPQRRAVVHRDGPLLVLAGPGSGKTRVITRRAAYLVHTGVPARNILAITFTNKAADEMRRRIFDLGVGEGMWVYTFHALGVRLLREFGDLARVRPGFSIYDEADRLRLVKEAMQVAKVAETLIKPGELVNEISSAKNRLMTPGQFRDTADFFERTAVANAYEAYEQLLEQRNAVDFDDLLMRVAIVLRDYPEIAQRLNIRFRYLLIDEYQDTNHAQYLIARFLSEQHQNICATGDPDQSIYGWRGADIGNILDFERDYPKAVVVRLEQNYRSVGRVLAAASALIARNRRRKHKDLWTQNPAGEPVEVWRFAEGVAETEEIARQILALHGQGRPFSDFAVFYRVNALSRGLEEALRNAGIPYRIARGVEFYNRKEIKDTLAYLRVLVNPADSGALLRIINTPPRGIGEVTVQRLVQYADAGRTTLLEVVRAPESVPALKGGAARKVRAFAEILARIEAGARDAVADAVSAALFHSGLEDDLRKEREAGGEDRLANVQELVTAARRYEMEVPEPSLADFLQRVALVSDQDQVDESAGVVMLMTLHAAKGLEFPVVFIVGLEQGLLPHETAIQESIDVEEERRLCFVGITRARERLILTHVRQRMIRGALLPRPDSQFLHELGDTVVETRRMEPPAWGLRRPGEYPARGWRPEGADADAGGWREDERPPDPDGFISLDDQRPAEVRRSHRRRWRPTGPEDVPMIELSSHRPVSANQRASADQPVDENAPEEAEDYSTWFPGTIVTHARYGVGEVVWIRPAPGQTRAAISFPGAGEKTFILELSPIWKLERGR